MKKRTGPIVKKFTAYVPPVLSKYFQEKGYSPARDVPRAMLLWMGATSEIRETVTNIDLNLPMEQCVREARRINHDGMRDLILLEYARSLPKEEQARIVRAAKQGK